MKDKLDALADTVRDVGGQAREVVADQADKLHAGLERLGTLGDLRLA